MNTTAPQTTRSLVHHACTAAGLLCLGFTSPAALAGIDVGITTQYPNNPELFLMLVDRSSSVQMNYTLDLNVRASTFFINAQQDTGSYLFFSLDPTLDAALQTFVATAGADLSNTRWAVLGYNASPADYNQRVFYTTLTNNGVATTQTTSYDGLFKMSNGTFRTNATIGSYLDGLNYSTPATIQMSTLNNPKFGSSLATVSNTTTYPSATNGWKNSAGTGDGDCIFGGNVCVSNPVGTSSWFYQAQVSRNSGGTPNNSLAKVAVDEFDNLTNDGYWGFIKDPNSNKYVLSYTLPGSNPKSLVSTDAGRARLSVTDYSASAGPTRLLTVGQDDIANAGIQVAAFANAASVSPVPEPQTWGLMALGGLLVAARARRERRNAGLSHRA